MTSTSYTLFLRSFYSVEEIITYGKEGLKRSCGFLPSAF